MTAVPMRTQLGQRSYPVVEQVLGGQVVEGRDGGIGVAGAGSSAVLGVAIDNAAPISATAGQPTTDAYGIATLVAAALPPNVTVVSGGREVPVTYAAAAVNGQALVAAAGGQVTPATGAATAVQIIGRCTELDGVAAGARGLMRTL